MHLRKDGGKEGEVDGVHVRFSHGVFHAMCNATGLNSHLHTEKAQPSFIPTSEHFLDIDVHCTAKENFEICPLLMGSKKKNRP